ncbi:Uncharacterized protein SCF082_LOCUS46895 [Durusdinium trenchii]|uniref:Uncharacterized protein n=1 Tax=Durusdinium trenchii TaxID=1381693 RepID=A0ABP0RHW2_9DINO
MKEDVGSASQPNARELIWEAFLKVTEDKNLGDWLQEKYSEPNTFLRAIERIVWGRDGAQSCPDLVTLIPNSDAPELFVGLHQLDYSKDAKSGYFPHMSTLKTHMRSIIFNNFDPFCEPLQVKFQDCADRRVDNFTIQYIDGFAKGLICQGIVGLIDLLEWPEDDLNSAELLPLLLSLRFFKALYRHQTDPTKYIYDALRVGHETSEKQAPSALELMGQFKKAMAQLRVSTGKTHPTPTALNMCIAEFNKLVQRKYKVDGPKRKVILSLLRVPEEFVDLLSGHYDKFKHSTSGVPRSACMYQEEVLPESYP